jgi:hypothetical protein
MNPDQTFPIKIIKQSSTNSGIFYNNSNNRLEFALPMNMNINPSMSAVEIKLNVEAKDANNTDLVSKPLTFYDKVGKRKTSADILFKNAYWKVSGDSLQLDSSPNHNVRRCTELQFSQDWIDQNAQSLNGNSTISLPSSNFMSTSIIESSPSSTLVKIPLSSFFGLAASQSSYLTSKYGSTKLIFELDDTKPDPFKMLTDTAATAPTTTINSLYGALYACNDRATAGGAKTIPSVTLTLPQSWTDAASSPFSATIDLNRVKLAYNEIVAGVATARSIVAKVTAVAVDANRITTLTLDNPVVALNNDAALTGITVQALLPGSYYSMADETLDANGQTTTLTSEFVFVVLNASATQYPNASVWQYVYTGLTAGVPTLKSINVTLSQAAANAANTAATITFAQITPGANVEVLKGGFLIPTTTLLNDAVTFKYNIPEANLILVQNDKIPKNPTNTFYTWSLERINMNATTIQTLNCNVNPQARMIMVLTPQQGGCISVLDNMTGFRMRLDEIDTSNRNIQVNTNTFYSLLARNYGNYRMLKAIVRNQSDDVDPQKDVVVVSQQIEFPCELFKADLYSTNNMSTKIVYVYQLLEMDLSKV